MCIEGLLCGRNCATLLLSCVDLFYFIFMCVCTYTHMCTHTYTYTHMSHRHRQQCSVSLGKRVGGGVQRSGKSGQKETSFGAMGA